MENVPLRTAAGLIALAALVGAAPANRLSGEDKARVEAALARGELLYELDRAAWVTTDDMMERLGRKDAPIKGWVVERAASGGGYAVTYFGDGPAGPVAWYAGAVRDGKVAASEVFAEGRRPPLSPAQLRLKAAADTARAFTGYRPCTESRFNVAVVPPPGAAGPIEVYLLSAQTESGVYPIGGHYLLRVDGGKVVSHRRFMHSCMNLDVGAVAKQGEPQALALTHLLDPVPTEIHVFVSISMKKPIYVMMKKRAWAVEGQRVRLLAEK
ncbi:MAG TPA: hypothetical protein VGB04_14625 [Allosphingosinicella sp.]